MGVKKLLVVDYAILVAQAVFLILGILSELRIIYTPFLDYIALSTLLLLSPFFFAYFYMSPKTSRLKLFSLISALTPLLGIVMVIMKSISISAGHNIGFVISGKTILLCFNVAWGFFSMGIYVSRPASKAIKKVALCTFIASVLSVVLSIIPSIRRFSYALIAMFDVSLLMQLVFTLLFPSVLLILFIGQQQKAIKQSGR